MPTSRRSFLLAGGGLAAAALAGCGTAATGPENAGGAWEYTDDLGVRVSLPNRPERVVAYVSGAAALWDFGVRTVGIYGASRDTDGRPSLLAGNVDLATQTSIGGEDYATVSLEKLTALKPDLVIASLNGETAADRWVIKDDVAEQIERICPIYTIQEARKPLPQIIEAYRALAERLGGDVTAPGITAAREQFDAASADLRTALAEKPGLRAQFVYADSDGMYVASPKFYSTLIHYAGLGMTIARRDDPSSEFYQQLSWEQAARYPADLILTDIREFSIPQREIVARFPTFASLPAVRAGQLGGWNGEPRFSYQQAVPEITALAASVRRSRTGVAG